MHRNNLSLPNNDCTDHSIAYSGRSEGHIYEEVDPQPNQPPPYLNSEMLEAHHRQQQILEQRMRGSPASLCSMCSIRCSGHHNTMTASMAPSLPACNCQSSCTLHTSSIAHTLSPSGSHLPLGCSRACTTSYQPACVHQNNAVRTNGSLPHTNCLLNDGLSAINQRYTGTMNPEMNHNHDESRSLSPMFRFMRKNNRDSKASTGNILDNSSSKSLLMCSRKFLLIILLTLILILVISVAVGLVVKFTGRCLVFCLPTVFVMGKLCLILKCY